MNTTGREFGWEDEILEEGGSYEPLTEGNYDYTVKKVERARSKGEGKLPPCNMAKVTFSVWGEDGEHEITENFVLHSQLEWKLSQLFLSVGMKRHGEPLRMNWTGIVGKTGKCRVVVRTFKKKNGDEGRTNGIEYYYAYDEAVTTVSPKANYAPQYSQPVQTTAAPKWTPGSF